MNIHILNESKQKLGGGFTFIRNFEKSMKKFEDIYFTNDWANADLVFIPSVTMVTRTTVESIKKVLPRTKIVVRLDNIPRNSRNRGAGTTRMFDIVQMADALVYQSEWARQFLEPFLKKHGQIIYNGVDTDVFRTDGAYLDFRNDFCVLYSRFNRDETKSWERAWYQFQMIDRQRVSQNLPRPKFIIAGQFSDELRAYNFDFFNGEQVEYIGIVDDPIYMAKVLRGCKILLAPYFNDCYSNTIHEALACGLELMVDSSGGTPELLRNGVIPLEKMAQDYRRFFYELV